MTKQEENSNPVVDQNKTASALSEIEWNIVSVGKKGKHLIYEANVKGRKYLIRLMANYTWCLDEKISPVKKMHEAGFKTSGFPNSAKLKNEIAMFEKVISKNEKQ